MAHPQIRALHFGHPTLVAALQTAAGPFLEAALALPAVKATSPERETTVRAIRAKFG